MNLIFCCIVCHKPLSLKDMKEKKFKKTTVHGVSRYTHDNPWSWKKNCCNAPPRMSERHQRPQRQIAALLLARPPR